MTCERHDWKPTGEVRPHIDGVVCVVKGHHHYFPHVVYVRCAQCKQNGFTRNGLVLTWQHDDYRY